MDKGKAQMSLDEVEVLRQSKKQKYAVSEDTLLFGGMSATRTPQTNLDTPSLQTPNFPARSSLTPFSETPMLSINQGQERTFSGLNPSRRVLGQLRRRENERQQVRLTADVEPIQLFVDDPLLQDRSRTFLSREQLVQQATFSESASVPLFGISQRLPLV